MHFIILTMSMLMPPAQQDQWGPESVLSPAGDPSETEVAVTPGGIVVVDTIPDSSDVPSMVGSWDIQNRKWVSNPDIFASDKRQAQQLTIMFRFNPVRIVLCFLSPGAFAGPKSTPGQSVETGGPYARDIEDLWICGSVDGYGWTAPQRALKPSSGAPALSGSSVVYNCPPPDFGMDPIIKFQVAWAGERLFGVALTESIATGEHSLYTFEIVGVGSPQTPEWVTTADFIDQDEIALYVDDDGTVGVFWAQIENHGLEHLYYRQIYKQLLLEKEDIEQVTSDARHIEEIRVEDAGDQALVTWRSKAKNQQNHELHGAFRQSGSIDFGSPFPIPYASDATHQELAFLGGSIFLVYSTPASEVHGLMFDGRQWTQEGKLFDAASKPTITAGTHSVLVTAQLQSGSVYGKFWGNTTGWGPEFDLSANLSGSPVGPTEVAFDSTSLGYTVAMPFKDGLDSPVSVYVSGVRF